MSPQGHASRLKYLERLYGETSVEPSAEAGDSTDTDGKEAHAHELYRCFSLTQPTNES